MSEKAATNGHAAGQHVTAAAKLRSFLARPNEILLSPGVYDGFTARIALQAGFECLYMVWLRLTVLVWRTF